jgi:hypothetical protein
MRPIMICLALMIGTGCGAAFGSVLATMAQVGQSIGSALSLAETGAGIYFARHPRADDEAAVRAALRTARATLVTYDRAVATGQGVDAAKAAALEAYDALRELLSVLGVLDARPPDGGAETEAPAPEPFMLPLASELDTSG